MLLKVIPPTVIGPMSPFMMNLIGNSGLPTTIGVSAIEGKTGGRPLPVGWWQAIQVRA